MPRPPSLPKLQLVEGSGLSSARHRWADHSKAVRKHFGRPGQANPHGKDKPLVPAYTLSKKSELYSVVQDRIMHRSTLKSRYVETAIAILVNLAIADIQSVTGRLSYSRRKASYAVPNGLAEPFLRFEATMQSIDALVDAGLARNFKSPSWPVGRGVRSTIELTFSGAKLVFENDWFDALIPLFEPERDVVIVKDRKTKARIHPPCADTAADLERRLAKVNAHITFAKITIPEEYLLDSSSRSHLIAVINPDDPGKAPVIYSPASKPFLYMPFLGDFEHGGRPVGWDAQNLPRSVRRRSLISGEPTAEVDLIGSHIAIAYALADKTSPHDDPYLKTSQRLGERREVVKRAALIALNSKTLYEAEASLAKFLIVSEEADMHFESDVGFKLRAQEILMDFAATHPAIRQFFFNDFGVRAQAHEAMIMLRVLEGAVTGRFHVVPLHDGALCPDSQAEHVRDLFQQAWFEEFGRDDVSIEIKRGAREGGERKAGPHVWNDFTA